jgi:hypothetical protein
MANSVFDALSNGKQQTPQNPMQMIQQLRSNPVGFLKNAGYNIPDGMNNPQDIVNHLMQSGQINNQRLQMAQKMAQQFFGGRK